MSECSTASREALKIFVVQNVLVSSLLFDSKNL